LKKESFAWICKTQVKSNLKDLKEIVHFIEKFSLYPDTLRVNFMKWKLSRNPYGTGVLSTARASNSGRVVSTCTVSPRKVWHDNSEHLGAQIGDTFTDEDYQRKGIFVTLVNKTRSKAESAGVKLFFGFPNANSFPGYVKKLGFIEVKTLSLHQFTMIIDWHSFIKQNFFHLRKSKIKEVEPKCNKATEPKILRFVHKIRESFLLPSSLYRVSELVNSKMEISDLWGKIRIHLGTAVQRDMHYLQWRYFDNPYPYRVWVVHRNESLVGYFVTLLAPYKGSDTLKRLILSDWVYEHSEGRLLKRAIIRHVIDTALKYNAVCINALHSSGKCQELPFRSSGFIKQDLARPVIVFGNEVGQSVLFNGKKWHITASDLDEF